MPFENLINRLKLLQLVVANPNAQKRISTAAAFTVLAQYKRRIFTDGLATDGSQIGQYSTKPFYQNPNKLTGVAVGGVTPLGKNGLDIFKNGRKKKTRYLSTGYKELRDLTGRQSDFVDLNFSGSTEGSIQVGESAGEVVIGFINEKSAEIMQGQEERFGKEIIAVSDEEREIGFKAARNELLAIIEEI
jgi:hypothetical protein